MGKIIISESQYKKVKKALIENAINTSILNEVGLGGENEPNYDKSTSTNTTPVKTNTSKPTNSGDLSYTVQSTQVSFENANNSNYPELKIFKGAKFAPVMQKNTFMDKLVANTKFQFIISASLGLTVSGAYAGEVVPSFDSDDSDETWDSSNKFYTYTNKVYFNCNNSRFSVPSNSPDKYFGEDAPAPQLVAELQKLCKRAKTYKSSYGSDAVGGGKSYGQQNDYIVKSDNGAQLKLPKGTAYVFKDGKNGASFRIPQGFGWFSCPSKTFLVNKVTYKDAKGFLAGNIVKNICTPAPSNNSSDNSSNNSSQTRQPGNNVVGGGAAPQSQTYDFENYI